MKTVRALARITASAGVNVARRESVQKLCAIRHVEMKSPSQISFIQFSTFSTFVALQKLEILRGFLLKGSLAIEGEQDTQTRFFCFCDLDSDPMTLIYENDLLQIF